MRKVLPLLLSVCCLVFNVAVAAALYGPGASSYSRAFAWLVFIPAILTLGSALYVINGRQAGRLGWDGLWDVIVVLPRWVQAGLVLLFVSTTAAVLSARVGPPTDVGSERSFAVVGVWLVAVGTALHYGIQRGWEPGVGRRSYRVALAVFVVVGVALAVGSFVL